MVYLKRGSKTFKCRVTAPDGRWAELSTGCRMKEDADDVEAAVRRWEGEKGKKYEEPALLAALVDKRISLPEAFEASLDGSLEAKLTAMAETPVAPAPVNLGARVTEWHGWKSDPKKQKKGVKSAADYLRQLGALYPEIEDGSFTIDLFTRVELAKRLDGLDVQGPTKNRYKLAASGFAKFLVRRGVIETNFCRDIEGFGENPARMVYYDRPEAKRLIFGLHEPIAGIAAFAAGFCMEWGGLSALMARDVSLAGGEEHVYVRGTKTKNRLRTVPLVEENRWLLPALERAIAGKAPNARVFAGVEKWVALKQQRKVARDLKIVAIGEDKFGQHSLHDWRHTHTVQLLRDGYDEAIAAAHLGHGDTNLVRTRYGLFIVTAADYRRKRVVVEPPTTSATTTLEITRAGGTK
jgi:integrase